MKEDKVSEQKGYDKPVAYDSEGGPLYAHPPEKDEIPHRIVHFSRSADPVKPDISPQLKAKNRQAKKTYPQLNLSEAEYVIMVVKRHPIGLFLPLIIGALLIAVAASLTFNYEQILVAIGADIYGINLPTLMIVFVLFTILVSLGMFVAYYVFVNNKFFLTNESVIQEIQMSFFAKREQTVSLANIEDASYSQRGLLQHLFNYGSIKLSTEGDETTYRFTYVANPRKQIAVLNNAVESFKNGRPVQEDF